MHVTSTYHARTLGVRHTDRHASRSSLPPAVRAPDLLYEADEIELACNLCVLECEGGAWVHERSCPRRLASSAQQAPAQ